MNPTRPFSAPSMEKRQLDRALDEVMILGMLVNEKNEEETRELQTLLCKFVRQLQETQWAKRVREESR